MNPCRLFLENPFNCAVRCSNAISESKIASFPFRVLWKTLSTPFTLVEHIPLIVLVVGIWVMWAICGTLALGPVCLVYLATWLFIGWCFLGADILYDKYMAYKASLPLQVTIRGVNDEIDTHIIKLK